MRRTFRKLLFFLRRDRFDRELEEEMRSHIEMRAEESVAGGMSPREARDRARRALGNMTLLKESSREAWLFRWLETTLQDLRLAIRSLRRNPGFALAAILTLAVAIGVNTSIFSIFNAVALRPVPVKEPDRLVRVCGAVDGSSACGHFSYPDYADTRDQSSVFSGLIAYTGIDLTLSPSENVRGLLVSANYFEVLGGEAAFGRTLGSADDSRAVVVLSHVFWQRRFGGDPNVVGKTISLNRLPMTVVGVARENVRGPRFDRVPDVWVPLGLQAELMPGRRWLEARGQYWLQVEGRLKPGITLEQSRAEMSVIARRLALSYPETNRAAVAVVPATYLDPEDRGRATAVAGLMLTAVGLVVLIACANVVNLLLARAAARRREIAIRLSLGSSRARLIRLLLTESLLVALLGGSGGILVAWWLSDLLVALIAGPAMQAALVLTPDVRVLGYTLLVSLLTGIGFGLTPALQASRPDLTSALHGGSAHPGRTARLRSALVVSEVALSLTLLVGSGQLVRALRVAQTTDPGFEIRKTAYLSIDYRLHGYDPQKAGSLQEALLERVAGLPGVTSVSLAAHVPLSGILSSTDFRLADRRQVLAFNAVSANFFETVGMPLVRGRTFTELESKTGPSAALVTDEAARRLWPGEDAMGKRLQMGKSTLEIIGLVRSSPNPAVREDEPEVFVPLRASSRLDLKLIVRSAGSTQALLPALGREARALDGTVFPSVGILEQNLSPRMRGERIRASLASGLGLLALVLASGGIYGVTSYVVRQRRHEIGVRMALGARPGQVLRLVLRQGMRTIVLGMAVGLAGAAGLSSVLSDLLGGLSPLDPIAYGGVSLLLLAVAFAALYVPARRALEVDPAVALRHE